MLFRSQLEEFFLTTLNLDWQTGECECDGECPYSVDLDYNLARNEENERLFRLQLRVVLQVADNCTGLKADAVIDGFFSFPEKAEEDTMQYLVRINGATILYGILRGQIAMVSGSFPTDKVNLPPVVMQDVLPEIDQAREKAETKPTKTRPRSTKSKSEKNRINRD